MDDRVVGELGPLPAGVAVHRVVAAGDRSDAAGPVEPAAELGDVLGAPVREGVAAVGEGVEDDVGDALLCGELDRGLDVLPPRVDAAVGDEAEEVEPSARALARTVAGGSKRLVFEEAAVGDRVVDPGEVLFDDGAGAEVEVTDLGVPHLALGEADVPPLGRELGVGKARPEPVEDGGLGERDGVAGPRLGDAPAVEDDECDRGYGRGRQASPPPRRSPRNRPGRGWRRRPGPRRCLPGPSARPRCRA